MVLGFVRAVTCSLLVVVLFGCGADEQSQESLPSQLEGIGYCPSSILSTTVIPGVAVNSLRASSEQPVAGPSRFVPRTLCP